MINRAALKSGAKEIMRFKKPGVYIVSAVFVAVSGILSILAYKLAGYDTLYSHLLDIYQSGAAPASYDFLNNIPSISITARLLIIAISIMAIVILVGYMGYTLKLSRGIQADVAEIFEGFNIFFKIIWLTILQGVFIILWSLLLVIPGIIAFYRYRQAYFILIDHPDMSALECIYESSSMMNGHKWELFVLDLSFLGWTIVNGLVEAIIILPLFSIWLGPYIGITQSGFYNLLSGYAPNERQGSDETA